MNLGQKNQKERIKAGMTQSSLADASLTNQNVISSMERGVNNFSREKLQFVVDHLGIQATDGEITRWHKAAHEPRTDLAEEPKEEVQEKPAEKSASTREVDSILDGIKTELFDYSEQLVQSTELFQPPLKANGEVAKLRKQIGFYQGIFSKLAAGDDSYRNGLIDAVKIYDGLIEEAET